MNNTNEEFQGGYADDGTYYAKGTFDNEIEYNNEVICLVNHTDDYFTEISTAVNEKQFDKVETILKAFEEHNNASIEGLNKLGPYEGDSDLLNTATAYLKELSDLIKTDYRTLFEMIKAETCTKQEFAAQRDKYVLRMQKNAETLNVSFQAFLEKHDKNDYDEEDDFEKSGAFHQGMEQVDFDPNNPMLQPIHGISLEDYAAANAKIVNGMSEDEVVKALGVERPQWDEANQLWQQRMQQDTEMAVIGLYGQYFATAENHPKFKNLTQDSSTPVNPENLAKIKEDPEFFFELSGAMQAAYNYGMDGAQWLRENYGLSIGEFQSVAMQYAQTPVFAQMIPFQEQKVKEYEAKFASESGGNIADDVTF